MNSIDIANGMIFQKLGVSIDTFDERLTCQKKLYLLEGLGTDLGYTYNWYVRGPYSPSLSNYVYNNLEVLRATDFSDYKLSKTAERHIEQVNSLLEKKRQDMGESAWYELLASLFYISKNKQSWQIDEKKESLFNILMKYKPQYNEQQCQHAYDVLRDDGFMEAGA